MGKGRPEGGKRLSPVGLGGRAGLACRIFDCRCAIPVCEPVREPGSRVLRPRDRAIGGGLGHGGAPNVYFLFYDETAGTGKRKALLARVGRLEGHNSRKLRRFARFVGNG